MKAKFTFLLSAVCVLMYVNTKAQNTFPATGSVGIGTTTPKSSAILDVTSITQGVLFPRMTQMQRNAISNPVKGLIIFQTDVGSGLYFYNGGTWVNVAKGANTSLSNLITPTAVNVDLLPNANNVISLGSSALRYKDVNLYNLKFTDGTLQTSAAKAYTAGTGISISGTTISATGGSSQWATNGSNIYNTNSGYVGIGISTPTLGGLVVNTKAGAVNAMFGSNTTGVAIESNYPGIGLNTYYNNGRKFISAGYGGLIGIDPTSGLMGFYNSASSGTAASAATLIADFAITASGNVGIGTTTPATGGLVVNTKAGGVNAMFGSNTTGVAIESANPGIGLNTYYNNGRKFIAAGYGGVIGLDPTSGLLGFYNSTASGSAGAASAVNADMVITAVGNVGIGITTPQAKLDVFGDALINGITIGNANNYSNTIVGKEALTNNTSGNYNSALGYMALYSNTTGYYNTATGINTLYSNTTGHENTANGNGSLYYNSNGFYNTAIGNAALNKNTSGSYNSALGELAFGNNISGSYNTVIGCYAGVSEGHSNLMNSMALGYEAEITGSNQVVVGNTDVTVIGGQVGWSNFSDGRFKKDIQQNVPGLVFINKLKPVTYHVELEKFEKFLGKKDSMLNAMRPELQKAEQKLRTGFVAQDVEQAAKEVNYDFDGVNHPQNNKDNYSLVYADFVPSLVNAIQELSRQNDSLKNQNQQLSARLDKIEGMLSQQKNTLTSSVNNAQTVELGSIVSLSQNVPNPFTNSTTINYSLPVNNGNAYINFYGANGTLLKTVKLSGNGKGSINIKANELAAGTYRYALVIDGKVIDTKQMISSK